MDRWVHLTFSQDTVGNWEFLCKENYLNNLIDPDVQKRLIENLINYTDDNLEDVSFKPLKAKLFNGNYWSLQFVECFLIMEIDIS